MSSAGRRGWWGGYHHRIDSSNCLAHVKAVGWGRRGHVVESLLALLGRWGRGHWVWSTLGLLLLLPWWWGSHSHRAGLPGSGSSLPSLYLRWWNHCHTAACNNQPRTLSSVTLILRTQSHARTSVSACQPSCLFHKQVSNSQVCRAFPYTYLKTFSLCSLTALW